MTDKATIRYEKYIAGQYQVMTETVNTSILDSKIAYLRACGSQFRHIRIIG